LKEDAQVPLLIGLGPTEILVVVAIVMLLFGGQKIPEFMRGLGEGVKEFKRGAADASQPSESPSSGNVASVPGGSDDAPSR